MSEGKSIEQYLAELQQINRQLQQDGVKMDDALELYQRGADLASEAQKLLDAYEERINAIEKSALSVDKS